MKLFFTFFSLFLAISIHAQDARPRKGFIFGVAFGGGGLALRSDQIGVSEQAGATFPNIKVGAMVSPKAAVVLLLPGSLYRNTWDGRARARGFEGFVPSFQYWPTNRWWLLGGAGVGMDAPAFYDIKDESERKFYFGAAGVVGTGFELWQRGRFALDVQCRAHLGRIWAPENRLDGAAFNVMLGLNWY